MSRILFLYDYNTLNETDNHISIQNNKKRYCDIIQYIKFIIIITDMLNAMKY